MLRTIRRRLSQIEEAIPLPVTAERFLDRAERHARRTGSSVDAAVEALVQDLSDRDLASLNAEFEQLAFGSDTAARDAMRSRVRAAAGYPSWTTVSTAEGKD